MLRVALSPYVAYKIGVGEYEAAVFTLAFAGALDWADGYIARRVKGQASVLGSFLDPLADKVLVGCTGLSLAFAGALHPALVFVVVGRDVLLIAGSLLYRAHTRTASEPFFSLARVTYKVEPTLISKVNTTLQLGLVVTALGSLAWPHAGLALSADTAALLPEWLQAATLPLPPLPVEAVADAAAASSVEAARAAAEPAGASLPSPAPASDREGRRLLTLTPAVTSLSWLVGGTTIWSGLDYLFREGFGQFKRRLAAGRGSAS
jgi:phosphatidylglycerophosphate synthase